ncbi:MAG TPA: FliH/SctL family protein [Phycisphaerales bacterium]|nr:FliH/SctL family protein [Phycisphaerales bacterium]
MIRQSLADRVVQDAIVLDLGDLTRQGEQVRAHALKEAEAILARAQQERQRLLASAKEEGIRQGHAEGLARGLEEGRKKGYDAAVAERRHQLDTLAAGWGAALAQFEAERDRMLLEAREDLVRLAVMLGERVTRRKIETDPQVVASQLESVLSLFAKPTRLTVTISTEDEVLAREVLPDLMARYPAAQHVDLRIDPALARGSCAGTTSGGGRIDASIPTQLDRIARALLPSGGEGGAIHAGGQA